MATRVVFASPPSARLTDVVSGAPGSGVSHAAGLLTHGALTRKWAPFQATTCVAIRFPAKENETTRSGEMKAASF